MAADSMGSLRPRRAPEGDVNAPFTDGPQAAVWLKAHLGAADATFELRGLRLDTFLPDGESALGSQLFVEIATPAYRAAG